MRFDWLRRPEHRNCYVEGSFGHAIKTVKDRRGSMAHSRQFTAHQQTCGKFGLPQFVVDKVALAQHVRQSLQQRSQITLAELLALRPIEQGLAELVAYLSLAGEQGSAVVDESVEDRVSWQARDGRLKTARLPRVIFAR